VLAVSDEYAHRPPDGKTDALLQEFRELSPRDQDLVMALVARLRGSLTEPDSGFPPDVAFMDFEE
jgi:hypothetical protein